MEVFLSWANSKGNGEVNENLMKKWQMHCFGSIMKTLSFVRRLKACAKWNGNVMQTCISRRAGSGTASCLYQRDGRCHSNTPQTLLHILYISVEPEEHRKHKSFRYHQSWKYRKIYVQHEENIYDLMHFNALIKTHDFILTTNNTMMYTLLYICIK